jgi:hypothetical protein
MLAESEREPANSGGLTAVCTTFPRKPVIDPDRSLVLLER